MADIVLIQPSANRFDKVSARVPNGLLSIAAFPEKAGYSVKIVDTRIDSKWQGTLKECVDKNTLCVGITCSTGRMITGALDSAQVVRYINPSVPIVWGGPHPTIMPEQTLSSDLVDIVVINEGEKVFMELISALASKNEFSAIKGIGYKINGFIKINSPAQPIEELDTIPILPYHLVDIQKYSTLTLNNQASLDLVTSRGCPYNCAFCSTPVISRRRWRAISAKKIIENIVFLKRKYGINTFYFVDDNFMVDLKRVEQFLDELQKLDFKINWGTQGVRVETINSMSDGLLKKIEESGCKELSIGVESANPKILEMIDKRITLEDVFEANRKLSGKNFIVKYNMIIGFPSETLSEIKKTVQLALRLYLMNKNTWFPFNIFTPFPGTLMFKKAVEYGFHPPQKLQDWARLESTGWAKYYGNWMTKKDNRILESINCTSYLAFPSAAPKISRWFLRMIFMIYQPIAYVRFKYMFYFMHIERLFIQEND